MRRNPQIDRSIILDTMPSIVRLTDLKEIGFGGVCGIFFNKAIVLLPILYYKENNVD